MLPSESENPPNGAGRSSKQIDLQQHEYRAGGVQGERLFGPGWPIGVITLIAIVIGTLTHDSGTAVHIIGAVIGAAIAGVVWTYYR